MAEFREVRRIDGPGEYWFATVPGTNFPLEVSEPGDLVTPRLFAEWDVVGFIREKSGFRNFAKIHRPGIYEPVYRLQELKEGSLVWVGPMVIKSPDGFNIVERRNNVRALPEGQRVSYKTVIRDVGEPFVCDEFLFFDSQGENDGSFMLNIFSQRKPVDSWKTKIIIAGKAPGIVISSAVDWVNQVKDKSGIPLLKRE